MLYKSTNNKNGDLTSAQIRLDFTTKFLERQNPKTVKIELKHRKNFTIKMLDTQEK